MVQPIDRRSNLLWFFFFHLFFFFLDELLVRKYVSRGEQNAKSTVRLSRDNEGNFGYIYSADQDAIDAAQQAVDDADNALYNLSLEGQQRYTEKYLQAQQDTYNELTELEQAWINGEIASEEEYQRRKDEILNHYLGEGGVLQTYSNLYRVACSADADAVADAIAQADVMATAVGVNILPRITANLAKIDWGREDGFAFVCARLPVSREVLETVKVDMIPYGCTDLRMTAMPRVMPKV